MRPITVTMLLASLLFLSNLLSGCASDFGAIPQSDPDIELSSKDDAGWIPRYFRQAP